MGKRRSRADKAPALPFQHRRALAPDDLTELPGLHVVDSAGDGDVIRYEVRVSERLDLVAHALFEVGEREEVAAGGVHIEVFLYLRRQVLVAEGQHPAVRVVDEVTTRQRYASPPPSARSRRSKWRWRDSPLHEPLWTCRGLLQTVPIELVDPLVRGPAAGTARLLDVPRGKRDELAGSTRA